MRSPLTPADILPLNRTLTTLEDLGSFAESGVFYVKPFRDWLATPWTQRIFGMRICNAGEVVEVLHQIAAYTDPARDKAAVFQVLSRALVSIDEQPVVDLDALDAFNKKANASLTPQSYLQLYFQNLEDAVVERLNFVYGGLQLKQQRLLRGVQLCDACGKEYTQPSARHLDLKYTLTEILCEECRTPELEQMYAAAKLIEVPKEVIAPVPVPVPNASVPATPAESSGSFAVPEDNDWICPSCNKPFTTFEEFQKHREQEEH